MNKKPTYQESEQKTIKIKKDDAEYLQTGDDNYRMLFEKMPNGFALHEIVTDEDGRPVDYIFIEVNSSFEKLTGLKKENLIGKKVTEALPGIENDPADWIGRYGKVALTGEEAKFENYAEPLNKWYSVYVYSPQKGRFAVIFEDITERKQVEEDRRNDYMNRIAIMVVVINTDGSVDFINRAGCEFLGYERDELIGKDWFDTVIPETCEKGEKCAFCNIVLGDDERLFNFETVVKLKSSERRTVKWHSVPILDDKGVFIGAICTGEDITDKKQAEDRLRLQSEIISNMTEGIYLIRVSDGIIVYTNTKLEQIFGYEPSEMVGKHVSIVNAPTDNDPDETAKEIMEIIAKTGEWHGEVKNINKDGTPFWCYANVSKFDHPDFGQVLLSVHTDISDRKKAEEEKQELWHQLLQSQKMDSIGQMTGIMAHDFRNILLSVIGFSDLALSELEADHSARGYMNRIKKVGEKATDLIDNLLAFSRKQELNSVNCNINTLINDCTELLSTMAGKSVQLTINTDTPVDDVCIDVIQIEQVLMNLTANARDAMGGVGRLTIETRNVELLEDDPESKCYADEKAGKLVLISVTDNGKGMTQEIQEKVFEPFFTTKESGKGNGLGLSAVFGIVKQHNGCIRVKSELNKGTTFEIFLPVHKKK